MSAPSHYDDVLEGEIVVQFAPHQEWPYLFDIYPLGVACQVNRAVPNQARQRTEITKGQKAYVLLNTAYIDDDWADAAVLHVILHELLHAMGFSTSRSATISAFSIAVRRSGASQSAPGPPDVSSGQASDRRRTSGGRAQTSTRCRPQESIKVSILSAIRCEGWRSCSIVQSAA